MKQTFLLIVLSFSLYSIGQSVADSTNDLDTIKVFYLNGNIKIQGTVKDDKKFGLAETYYESGQLRSETFWENDVKNGISKKWFENGYLKLIGTYKDDKYTGIWKYYSEEDGQLLYSIDCETHQVTTYFPDEVIKTESFLINEKKQGVSRTYYPNGQIETENNWKNDIQIGVTKKWFKNGNLQFIGQFENGQETGKWEYFDQIDETPIYTVTYDKGKVSNVVYEGKKYRWRNFKFENLKIQFPSFVIDSFNLMGIQGYWTMFPSFGRENTEYYSLSIIPIELFQYNIDSSFNQCNTDNLSKEIKALIINPSNDSEIPSLKFDEYTITKIEEIKRSNFSIFQLEILFKSIEIELSVSIIPYNESIYIAAAYFNKKVKMRERKKFLDSIELIKEN